MNKKTISLVLVALGAIGLGWYHINTNEENFMQPIQKTQAVSMDSSMQTLQPFQFNISSTSYTEVVDPQVITVNNVGVTIDNRVEVGSTLSDIALDKPTGTFDTIEKMQLSELEGLTMIYSLPSLDTPVCTKQTREIEYAGKNFESVNFVTISHDMPFALKRFCGDNNIDNILTLSDARSKLFAQANGLYISEFDLMTRAAIVVNEQLEVLYVDYADEVTQDVDLVNAFAFLNTQ